MLTALTRQVLQTALEVEMAYHLGYAKGDPLGRAVAGGSNIRNGSTPKTVRTEIDGDDTDPNRLLQSKAPPT